MSAFGPSSQTVVEKRITVGEDPLTDHGTVVIGPASYDGIEVADDRLLGSGLQFPYLLCHPHRVLFDGFLTGRDDGFEAKRFSIGVLARMRLAYGKLPDGKPEKSNPTLP